MAVERELSDFAHELELFCRVAEELQLRPGSLREIATRLDINSPSVVSNCLKRLSERYGKRKLVDITSTSGRNTLTDEGRQLLEKGRAALDGLQKVWHEDQSARLRIAASHLLLVYVLPSFIRRYLAKHERFYKQIDFNDACAYEETLELIDRGGLDFAVVWNLEGRESYCKAKYPFVKYERFTNEFDVVVICGPRHRFAERLHLQDPSVNIKELAGETVFVLEGQHQPFLEKLPYPDEKRGGRRVELKDYSTIIAHVRMGIDGVALVPGVYRELDYYQKLGTLAHLPVVYTDVSEKGSADGEPLRMGVAGVYKLDKLDKPDRSSDEDGAHTMSEEAWELYGDIKGYYDKPFNMAEPGWRTKKRAPVRLPRSLDFREYGQAYFMALTSERTVKLPEWHSAILDWEESAQGGRYSGKLRVVDSLANTALCKSYAISAGPISDSVFSLTAEPLSHGEYAPAMIAVFNMSFRTIVPGETGQALFGFWHGTDSDNKPMMAPFILCRRDASAPRLPHYAIAAVARFGMLRVSTNHVDRPPRPEDGSQAGLL
ncbi:LysR family transcriptional regulator [Aquisphaera insulae]|uniref:LysR family transcriptional regulator n=1 Tax=Aquisphaera insulae TaxID=2712864 RepID=UPI0013EE1B66|nr:LysR family transcriptional regulator [Aquisphaera insulae]